jgi:pimeloyl-ACP methyl ester carboxylesterase
MVDGKQTRIDVEFFEKSVRPLLEEHCVQCHSASKGKTKGGLALDNASAVLKGGDTGPALVPGSPEKSLLIKAVSYTDPELKMPPDDKQMPKADVAILQEWIHRGAYDPREGRATSADPEAAKNHWAFQPLSKPQPPAVQDTQWPRTDTDRFVLAALDAKGIRPSPDAGKRELLRRVSYDLTGLPPTAEELDAYRAPFAEAGEGRRPTLTWPRQIPIDDQPPESCAIVARYSAWLAASDTPKLFINAEPGMVIAGRVREVCRTFRNQQEVTVPGLHFIQEDSPDAIAAAIAAWLPGLAR